MSAEHGGQGQKNFRARDAVGIGAEVGGLGIIAYNIVTAALLWPIAIGGAIFLVGRGIRKSGGKQKTHH
ncbi:MAG TPA: hypothetical protein VM077_05285 [Candidatus Limnocylindrales bacterium]|nr:hypothetical protein [Candidatus Limnocylindrales bacterium]